MTDYGWWIGMLLTPAVIGIVGFFGYVEYQARLTKTQVFRTATGLRFVAKGWSVEMQRGAQLVLVKAQQGQHRRAPVEGGEAQVHDGTVQQSLPAPGLRIRLEPHLQQGVGDAPGQPSGMLVPVFEVADAAPSDQERVPLEVLRLAPVPSLVAAHFDQFAGQLRVWVGKLEHNLALQAELEAQQLAAQEAIKARAEAKAKKDAELALAQPVDPDVQIARWRKEAGFSGTSETGLTEDNKIEWFIDLEPRGRVILHAGGRTLYTTLLGATIKPLGAELEIGVRDQFWTEAEAELQTFKLFRGAHSDVRRAWKERLEILANKLRVEAGVTR